MLRRRLLIRTLQNSILFEFIASSSAVLFSCSINGGSSSWVHSLYDTLCVYENERSVEEVAVHLWNNESHACRS